MQDVTRKTETETATKWAVWSDRLAIAGVVVVLLVLFFFLVDGAVLNFSCSFADFITFKCNRWDVFGKS